MDRLIAFGILAALVVPVSDASASLIFLSEASSDETPAEDLQASLDFMVSGNSLILTVSNLTPGDGTGFDISELFFNAPADVVLAFETQPGWTLKTDLDAGAFGMFDFALIDGQGAAVNAGESRVFEFTILAGSPSDIDFTSLLSTIPPGDTPSVVAAKFIRGPGDDSAFGGTSTVVPAPGVAALLLLGGLVGTTRRRRRD